MAKNIDDICEVLNTTYDGEAAEREKIFILANYFGWDTGEDNDGMLIIYTNQPAEEIV